MVGGICGTGISPGGMMGTCSSMCGCIQDSRKEQEKKKGKNK